MKQSSDKGFSQLLFSVCKNIYQCHSQLGGSNAIKLRGWDRAFTTEIKTGAFHFSKKTFISTSWWMYFKETEKI